MSAHQKEFPGCIHPLHIPHTLEPYGCPQGEANARKLEPDRMHPDAAWSGIRKTGRPRVQTIGEAYDEASSKAYDEASSKAYDEASSKAYDEGHAPSGGTETGSQTQTRRSKNVTK